MVSLTIKAKNNSVLKSALLYVVTFVERVADVLLMCCLRVASVLLMCCLLYSTWWRLYRTCAGALTFENVWKNRRAKRWLVPWWSSCPLCVSLCLLCPLCVSLCLLWPLLMMMRQTMKRLSVVSNLFFSFSALYSQVTRASLCLSLFVSICI